jgi:TRAP transporter 4TM/12TM fusion protein
MEDAAQKRGAGLASKGPVDIFVMVASGAVALLYIYTAYFGQLPLFQQRGIILAFCFALTFIKFPMLKGRRPWWTIATDIALILVTILAVSQLIRIEILSKPGFYYRPGMYDLVIGFGLILATLEATRRTLGPILPGLGILFLLYAVFGHNLPGMLRHLRLDLPMIIYYVALSTEGIFGLPLYVASTIVIIFLILASMLRKFGLMDFFIDLSSGLMGKYRGGPAKVAVLTSAFMATMSGSAVANVAATGSFSIPLMKKIGYRPNFAGAVEACASTGGVITPPIMGAAAFIMAEYLDINYWSVCVAAFLPSVLYFLGVYLGVDLEALKTGLKGLPKKELPDVKKILLKKGYMLAPILVLVYFLGVVKSSAMLAAFWGLVSILAAGLIKKETRKVVYGLGLLEGMADAVRACMVVVATCACAGIVVGVLTVTGLGMRMSTILIAISGGHLLNLLLLCGAVCIVLGMGITTTAIYLLMAIIVAPAIEKLGVLPLAAHLFVFFLANLSNITPPVCVAVYVASGISEGEPFPTGWEAIKLGAVLFIVPFFFCYHSSLILHGSILDIAIATISAIVGVISLSFASSNYFWWGKIGLPSRVLFGLGGLALIYPRIMISLIGVIMISGAFLFHILIRQQKGKHLGG